MGQAIDPEQGDAVKNAKPGEQCSIALDVSEHLFKLTTESLRLRSNETRRFQTLESLLSDRVNVPCVLTDHPPETIREHLSAIPTEGDIRIDLSITKSSADDLDTVKRLISEGLGSEITLGDAVSVMLFHYVADVKAAPLVERFRRRLEDSPSDGGAQGNVVPFR